MSINSALSAGVTGLVANSAAVSAISDNISNANTVGYKRNEVDFSSIVTAQAVRGLYSAGGVAANATLLVSQQGQLNQSQSSTDLAINGNGMFVTTSDPTNTSPTDPRFFTRAGSFSVDKQGYLKNTGGLYLQGWIADSSGVITANPTDINVLKPINVLAQGGAASPTTIVAVNANLQSTTTPSTAATSRAAVLAGTATATQIAAAYNPSTNSMAMYNAAGGTGVKPDFSIQVPVADSQGGPHTVQIDFLKSTTANQWYAEMHAVPATDVTTGSGLSNGQIATGVVSFTPTGQYDATNTTLFSNASSPTISIGSSTAGAPGAGAVNWSPSLGIAAQSISLQIGTAPGGLTQFASQSVTQSLTTNGTNLGNLSNVTVDDKGFVTANYDNGVSRQIAQVAIATFPNPNGLQPVSGDAFQVTTTSGTYSLKTANVGGAGKLSPQTLEASTVDLSSEFTNLIVTQRAYSASSKIITTADQMLQDLLATVR
jgi:flagellar hook protein FlgE